MADKKKFPGAAKDSSKSNKTVDLQNIEMPFVRQNYVLMIVGVVLIFLGYLLMIGGGSKDPNVFSPALFDFQRLTLSPLLILAGFVVEIVAIMRKPKAQE